MIKIENVDVCGWEAAIRGMRNPLLSHDKSDSYWTTIVDEHTLEEAKFEHFVGDNDLELMKKLVNAGSDHSKFMRYITVTCDITAPDYWFKEFSTYRVGVTENSTSTMHRIHSKEFTLDDFSCEHLYHLALTRLKDIIDDLNTYREFYLESKSKDDWWQLIQLLPMSYNYRRTVIFNYQVLRNMYHSRKNHKLDEWRLFCEWVETLPYSELITM